MAGWLAGWLTHPVAAEAAGKLRLRRVVGRHVLVLGLGVDGAAPLVRDGLHAAVEGDGQLEEVLAEQVIERPRRLRDLMGASQ